MRTRYYTFGGQPIPHVYRWNGYPSTLTRNAAETRGLSSDDEEQVEYLPARASGPEPMDPGETGLSGFIGDNKNLLMLAGAGLVAWMFFKKKLRKNPPLKTLKIEEHAEGKGLISSITPCWGSGKPTDRKRLKCPVCKKSVRAK